MKYYIIDPEPDINSLCSSILESEAYHSELSLVDSNKKKKTVRGWEANREQLGEIRRAAQDKNIPLRHFKVVVLRIPF